MHPYIDLLTNIITLTAITNVVTAFAPSGRLATRKTLKMGFEDELGVLPPVGFFDPLGMTIF